MATNKENFYLPSMGADPKLTTVTGISSGSTMAMQLLVAHSDWIYGAALPVGGSYATNEYLKKVNDVYLDNVRQMLEPEEQKIMLKKIINKAQEYEE